MTQDKTPYEQAGYTKDMKFKFIGTNHEFNVGEVVWLLQDDGTECTTFTNGEDEYYLYVRDNRYSKSEIELVKEQHTYKVGDLVEVVDMEQFRQSMVKVGDVATVLGAGGNLIIKADHWEDDQVCTLDSVKPYTEKASSLKFPCCISSNEIKDEATFEKVKQKFIDAGAKLFEEYYRSVEDWEYFGVDWDKETLFLDGVKYYSKVNIESEVTVYSLADVLGTVPEVAVVVEDSSWIKWNGGDAPVPVGTKVDVKYGDGKTAMNVGSQDGSNGEGCYRTCTSWKHWQGGTGADIVAYRLHTPAEVLEEVITEGLEDKPIVGIDLAEEGSEKTVEALVSITQEVKYTVVIKGVSFNFTQEELDDLAEELLGFTTL